MGNKLKSFLFGLGFILCIRLTLGIVKTGVNHLLYNPNTYKIINVEQVEYNLVECSEKRHRSIGRRKPIMYYYDVVVSYEDLTRSYSDSSAYNHVTMNDDRAFVFTLQTKDGDEFKLLSLNKTLKSEDVKYIKKNFDNLYSR